MKPLRAREKADFYEQIAVLLDAGVPISRAVGMASDHIPRAGARAVVGRCSSRLLAGQTFSDSMAGDPWAWEAFEWSVLAAGEEAGKIGALARELGRYWRMMDETRRLILTGLLYPLLILHVAVVAGAVPVAISGGPRAAAMAVLVPLAVLYAVSWFLWELGTARVGRAWLRHLPLVGRAQSSLHALRFALCLRLQVEAGIPIFTALPRAARAAGGASLGRAADGAVERLRAGESVADVLPMLFSSDRRVPALIATGLESGRVGAVLRAIEEDAAGKWREAMGLLQVWFPRLVYFIAMGFAVWQIARLAAGIYGTYSEAASTPW